MPRRKRTPAQPAGPLERKPPRKIPPSRAKKKAGAKDGVLVLDEIRNRLKTCTKICENVRDRTRLWISSVSPERPWTVDESEAMQLTLQSVEHAIDDFRFALSELQEVPDNLPIERDHWIPSGVRRMFRPVVGDSVLIRTNCEPYEMAELCGIDLQSLKLVTQGERKSIVADQQGRKFAIHPRFLKRAS